MAVDLVRAGAKDTIENINQTETSIKPYITKELTPMDQKDAVNKEIILDSQNITADRIRKEKTRG
jgi:hypothetical protein